jgi:hypothetical protein
MRSKSGRTIIDCTCMGCGIVFRKKENDFNVAMKKGARVFCTRSCSSRTIQREKGSKRELITCPCGKTSRRSKSPSKLYCSVPCYNRFSDLPKKETLTQEIIRLWQNGEFDASCSTASVHRTIRKFLLDSVGNKCQRCDWSEVNPASGRVPLHVDHVDGNWKNSSKCNLVVLCPNCHSITPKYGALNKGNGRPRYIPKWIVSHIAETGQVPSGTTTGDMTN